MTKHLILMRGHSGSGKSTRAALLRNNLLAYRPKATFGIFSADDYFIGEDGVYRWDGERLMDAHRWCRKQVRDAIFSDRLDFVFVDNTNIFHTNTMSYADDATEAGYSLWVHQTAGNFQNAHNVPAHTVARQKAGLKDWPLELFCTTHTICDPRIRINILRDTTHFQEIVLGNSGSVH